VDQSDSWVALASEALSAAVNPHGAELSELRDAAGQDLLWNGDPAVWSGRAPILFPIVGTLAGGVYRLGARQFPLPRHGFARRNQFQLLHRNTSSAAFRLKADERTLQVYPFDFELDIEFALEDSSLNLTATVRNLGDDTMPASIGYHPAFRWPLPYGEPRASHFIEFEFDETAPVRRLDPDGLLTTERHASPIRQRRLLLADALFENDALIFDDLRSRHVTYGAATGPRIRLSFPDAPYLGIWSKPGAGFVCIEPWQGIADPHGYEGTFSAKPGIFRVAPRASFVMRMSVTLLQPRPL
jgi:galactose mutarotase-like enzyme